MLKIIKKYYKWIIIFSFAYVYALTFLLAPSNYKAITPGEATKITDTYNIEDVDFSNNISTVSVYSWQYLTVFQKWITENSKRFAVSPKTDVDKSLSYKDILKQGKISHDSSNNNAIITAYEYANKIDPTIQIDYELNSLTVYLTNNSDLKIGDEILLINNKDIRDYLSYEDFLTVDDYYQINNPTRIVGKNNNSVNIVYQRGSELYSTIFKSTDVIYFYPKYTINETTPKLNNIKYENVSGPSGGMVQTLAIYTALLNIDFGKVKIAGTGTINTNNSNSVEVIGGLVQKYYTVKENKVDYFIVPKKQLNELNGIIKPKDKVVVIGVSNFDEVISEVVELLKVGNDND